MGTFFTIQPSGACLFTESGGKSTAFLVLPNYGHALPRARAAFWKYGPDAFGWQSYGAGTVTEDGRSIVPDKGVSFSDFSSAECDTKTRSHIVNFDDIDPQRLHHR